jgi:hypothetical protein
VRKLLLAPIVALVLVSPSFGGGGGSIPDGASVAPASAPAFIAINTDFTSDQWKSTTALFDKFPGGQDLLAQIQKGAGGVNLADLKAAVGPEVDLVLLDLTGGKYDTVAMTKPKDKAKLDALLAQSKPPSKSEEVEGWTVTADSQATLDAFDAARASGKLSDVDLFKKAMKQLPSDAMAKLYVSGKDVQEAVGKALASSGATAGAVGSLGSLDSIAAAASAEQDGVSVDGDIAASPKNQPEAYTPTLPSELPAGALLLVSFAHLDKPLKSVLEQVKSSNPSFSKQLGQAEGLLGLSVEGDVLPALGGEGAVAVYPPAAGDTTPAIALVLKVDDEAKVRDLLKKLVSLARLSGQLQVITVTVGGVEVQKFTIQGVSVLVSVFDGKLVVTNADSLIEALHATSGNRLGDDLNYQEATKNAGLPSEVLGFAYANLESGLPAVFGLAEQSGSTVPQTVRENTKPLKSVLLYASKDGDRFSVGGFLTIK